MNKKIVITGTHLTPALALMDKLKENSYQLYYLGRNNTFDKELVTKRGVHFTAIRTPKLKRHQLLLSTLNAPLLIFSLIKSIKVLVEIKPITVVSFGGFVALPVCLAAKILRIKLVIHEQTLKAGLTTKLTAPLAKTIAISWPQSQKYFKKDKTVLTGNLVRKELLKITLTSKLTKTIYITGGSQGSLVINQVTTKLLKKILKNYRVFHQFGLAQDPLFWQQALDFKNNLPENLKKKYTLRQWFSDKELSNIFSSADLLISRSGINTVTEALLLKIRSILIPLPYTQKNEQLNNANFLKNQGLAMVIKQKNLNPDSLLTAIKLSYKTLPKPLFSKTIYPNLSKSTDKLFKLVK
jgi:UDP-N-acetylglucosamine--N-acetylmuramyl-(pentapeptide) pyrophosphoryl-undecaprenol N-acetylglucosamine transferase